MENLEINWEEVGIDLVKQEEKKNDMEVYTKQI